MPWRSSVRYGAFMSWTCDSVGCYCIGACVVSICMHYLYPCAFICVCIRNLTCASGICMFVCIWMRRISIHTYTYTYIYSISIPVCSLYLRPCIHYISSCMTLCLNRVVCRWHVPQEHQSGRRAGQTTTISTATRTTERDRRRCRGPRGGGPRGRALCLLIRPCEPLRYIPRCIGYGDG